MSINTNLSGRLRNTSLKYSHALMPLFEAVVNSIHAIEETKIPIQDGCLNIEICEDSQPELINNQNPFDIDSSIDITGFKITDNGAGFTEQNMESFKTLDSDYKASKGGRGIGRLLWLKAFERVHVQSQYTNNESKVMLRKFSFESKTGVNEFENKELKSDSENKTIVHLDGFISKYKKYSKKTLKDIADALLEHCLWYFVRTDGVPSITISCRAKSLELQNVYTENTVGEPTPETNVQIKQISFDLTHVKLRNSLSLNNTIAYCADGRLVKDINISGKVPGLYGKIRDPNGDFIYACYVVSDYLNDRVHSERTDFDIEESSEENDLLDGLEVSFHDISTGILERVKAYLSDYLEENKKESKKRIDDYVSGKAPRYKSIMHRIPEDELNLDPSISDKDLEITLHKQLMVIESKLISDGHNVMKPGNITDIGEYEKKIKDYLDTVSDIKKSDLANYVSHRKVVLDLLEKAIRIDENGKYVPEELIHNLIMPMGKDSNQIFSKDSNLWIVDERLAFHNYLGSDKTLSSMPITDSKETKEPDLVALKLFDNPLLVSDKSSLPLASITVIEIKRPMRNDASSGEDKDPIEQAIGYLDRIRKGKVQTVHGLLIPGSQSIPGFCYILSSLTATVKKRCDLMGLTLTSDGTGYFGYNPNYHAYLEVISYDRLVESAKQRNRAFFDKLGLPTT